MNFSDIPLFYIMKTKMDYLSQRQGILAQNIANADTPKYKAKDITAPDFNKLVGENGAPAGRLRLAAPSDGRMMTGIGPSSDFKVIDRATTSELNPDGNNVSVEDETAQMAMNQADYQKVLNLYSKAIGMFKTAIGNPNTGS